MKILLASPVYSSPWFGSWFDCGAFIMKALHQLGHSVAVWDFRLEPLPPVGLYDLAIVWKGNKHVHQTLPHPKVCYWPDKFGRDPENEEGLESYNKVFTPVRPTPEGMEWLPTGWDPDYHKNLHYPIERRNLDILFIGTKSERKLAFLSEIKPDRIYGNGWESSWGVAGLVPPRPAVYVQEFVNVLNTHYIAVNIHRDKVGLNSRLFEFAACTFMVTDRVPGVEEVFGKELAQKISFNTPKQGRAMVEHFYNHPELREELWKQEYEAVKPFTYLEAAKKMIASVT